MNYATIDNFSEVWKIFQDNKQWFPHVRTSHVRNRLSWGQVILQDGVVITQQQYKRNGKIGKDSDVKIEKGDYIIHQIINSNPKNGNAKKVIEEYFDHVKENVFLTGNTIIDTLVVADRLNFKKPFKGVNFENLKNFIPNLV